MQITRTQSVGHNRTGNKGIVNCSHTTAHIARYLDFETQGQLKLTSSLIKSQLNTFYTGQKKIKPPKIIQLNSFGLKKTHFLIHNNTIIFENINPNNPKQFFDFTTGKELNPIKTKFGFFSHQPIAITSDAKAVIVNWKNMLTVAHFLTGEMICKLENSSRYTSELVFKFLVTSDGRFGVRSMEDSTTKIWDLTSGKMLHSLELKDQKPEQKKCDSIAISPDQKILAMKFSGKFIILLDIESGQLLNKITEINTGIGELSKLFLYFNNKIFITADGNHLVTGTNLGACIWDLKTAQFLKEIRVIHPEKHWLEKKPVISSIAMTSDNRLAVALPTGAVEIWDIEKNQCLHHLISECNRHVTLEMAPDGQTLFVYKQSYYTAQIFDLTRADLE